MKVVDLSQEEQDKIIDYVFNDSAMMSKVVKLVECEKQRGTTEVLNAYRWGEMVNLELAVIGDEINLLTGQYTVTPTDLAVRIYQAHKTERALKGNDRGTASW